MAGAGGSAGRAGDAASGAAVGGSAAAAGSGLGGTVSIGQAGAGDGGAAGASPTAKCSVEQPFRKPRPLAELNTARHEAGARLTGDELNVVYLCTSTNGVAQVCLAQRESARGAFGAPSVLIETNGGVPWISNDLLTLWFENEQTGNVYASQRKSPSEAFTQIAPVAEPHGYGDPYVVGGENGNIYFSTQSDEDFVMARLKAWKPGAAVPIPGAGVPTLGMRPVPSEDELTFYFGAAPPSGTTRKLDVWVKTRTSRQVPFGEPANVSELNTATYTYPSWISPDGCRLYFDAGDAVRDLYVADRQ
jgi:hypothetical protein